MVDSSDRNPRGTFDNAYRDIVRFAKTKKRTAENSAVQKGVTMWHYVGIQLFCWFLGIGVLASLMTLIVFCALRVAGQCDQEVVQRRLDQIAKRRHRTFD